jgi:hypothetical protein
MRAWKRLLLSMGMSPVLICASFVGCAPSQHYYLQRTDSYSDSGNVDTTIAAGPFRDQSECADAQKVYQSSTTSGGDRTTWFQCVAK